MALRIERTFRLKEGQYFPSRNVKTGIAIHHTVGGSAESTFNYWNNNDEMVGTAYIIDRDGTVLEVFDPAAWAWQFGLKWSRAKKIQFEKRYIGIEIASEGGLIESGGNLYCFDRISSKTLKPRNEAFDFGREYRGYRYFDRYEDAQVDSLLELVDQLCTQFGIQRQVPENFFDYYGESLTDFEGIIGHTMVRKDKSDPAPVRSLWDRITTDCGVTPASIGTPSTREDAMTEEEVDQLFEHNVQQINQMNVSAGSMVKGLLMELERGDRKTYIRLTNPVPNGHAVDYEFVQGDKSLVGKIARALGFKTVTETRLEVRSA
jgi:hypothetical protein